MAATVTISDDFDLEKIRKSGQCFRITRRDDEGSPVFTVVSKNHYLEMSTSSSNANEWNISCTKKEFSDFWATYFDLDRSYEEIRNAAECDNAFLNEALYFGRGLRILKQDPWEMIVTFIISQRRSMPAIATAVDKICHCFGDDNGKFFEFPSA
ncbi:MAG: 8-oxoguanine DNA glycosylase, N-terminal domain-containing protein, partial [Phoenicibacter congonensis]|nr:8-oxoguanine DNA glycosylase, N-terminal domain-containing protein [Phoenicibacter congonensis]